jgi:hypothetical protein
MTLLFLIAGLIFLSAALSVLPDLSWSDLKRWTAINLRWAMIPLLLALFPVLANALPAFPGAGGWGGETPGGRGGKVYIVTNTNSFGPGSFNSAWRASGKRTIVFAVSGVIDLHPTGSFVINSRMSEVTIAGQTSPGGITLTGSREDPFWSYDGNLHDGIFRFLRMRASAGNGHAANIHRFNNFIFDHCDFSGGNDECFSVIASHHWTVQWCTIANSAEGQTYGSLIGYSPTSHITMHHNLWANHVNRGGPHMHWSYGDAPYNGMVDYRNNVCYNVQIYTFDIAAVSNAVHVNLIGNYFKAGPVTPATRDKPQVSLVSGCFARDNIWHKGAVPAPYSYPGNISTEWQMASVETEPAIQAFESVMNEVGAFPRDPMNSRTIQEVRGGTGSLRKINDPRITSGPAAPADTDLDGMPDFWETGMGFNPGDASDNIGDHDGDGYTNIEEYINDLANARLCRDYFNPVYPIPDNWDDYDPSCCKSLAVDDVASNHFLPGRNSLALFPNPFNGQGNLNIALRQANHDRPQGFISLHDVQGRKIRSYAADRKVVLTNLALTPGIYMVRWQANSKTIYNKRIVVVK